MAERIKTYIKELSFIRNNADPAKGVIIFAWQATEAGQVWNR